MELSRIQKGTTMSNLVLRALGALFMAALTTGSALADASRFSVLYSFDVADAVTGASASGSQPDTLPVLGPDHSVLGMTYTGGMNGNGMIYRFDLRSHAYMVLHTFGALDANGANEDGANPGVALTRGKDDVFYGMASFGGPNGTGTIFSITASGEFTVLHSFSAVDTNLHNEDGANPLRTLVIGEDGDLYGTTRLGGQYTCGPKKSGCGVAWVISRTHGFRVLHQFQATEGHAASLLQARDGLFYGCAVWPFASAALASGTLFRMAPSGERFEVLYRFTALDGALKNVDGGNCYEPLIEQSPGVFYGAAKTGGASGNGTVFRYSLAKPGLVESVHTFSALNSSGENADGANPYARLTRGSDGAFYSTTAFGGAFGSGVVYKIRADGHFQVVHNFTAADPLTGSNIDGVEPDYGVLLDEEDSLIGMADYGGKGSIAGATGNGTLYRITLDQ
jgi:uncharacterized repeat protein (TIGR03803 family)